MLSVAEALHQVLEHSRAKHAADVLLANAIGSVLAEDVASDVDSPPHDKSIVDGYAVCGADIVNGCADLHVLEEITAGMMPTQPVKIGHCSRIMTGAAIPEGADSVVMIERTQLASACVEIRDERFCTGQNVMRQGSSMRKGEVVLRSGVELGPAEIGLLAEVGRPSVSGIGGVEVAILSTGNELVSHDQTPAAAQIRNSNGPMLDAFVRRAGATPINLGIARDDVDELRRLVSAGLQHDVLVLSGGVSMGVLDLVPAVLSELRVEQVFHKVRLKPGKPLLFGIWSGINETPDSRHQIPSRCLVFALPGNPVSSFVSFELFGAKMPGVMSVRILDPPIWQPTRDLAASLKPRRSRARKHRSSRPSLPHPRKGDQFWHNESTLRMTIIWEKSARCQIGGSTATRRQSNGCWLLAAFCFLRR